MSKQPQFTREQVLSWRHGYDGFCAWLKDVQPRIVGADGKFRVFELQDFQADALKKALAMQDGKFTFSTLIFTWPRRHSKSTINALLCLWRLCTRQNENIVAIASNERQILSVGFTLCKKIVLNTPALIAQIGKQNIFANKIEIPVLNSTLRTASCNVAGLYGERITCGWCSELHSAASDEALQVLASSIGDSINSFILIDSTTDGAGGSLHHLETLAQGDDKSIFVSRIEYANLQEAVEKSPHWIRKEWLASRAKQLLPAVFASQHLNLRQEGSNCLFTQRDIEAAKDGNLPAVIGKAALQSLVNGRAYAVGCAVDRAYGFSSHGDKTIITTVCKVSSLDPNEEPHFYVLRQENIFASLAKLIKKNIQGADDEYKLQGLVFETYNSQDLHHWALTRGYPSELVFANHTAQTPAFLELHRLFVEGRIHFSADLKELEQELAIFEYRIENSVPKFGNNKAHDDRVYSLCWSIHSLRQRDVAIYELQNIVCDSKSQHAHICYIRGGDAVLNCSYACETHLKIDYMYKQYQSTKLESEMTLQRFYELLVQKKGVAIIR